MRRELKTIYKGLQDDEWVTIYSIGLKQDRASTEQQSTGRDVRDVEVRGDRRALSPLPAPGGAIISTRITIS
jgi:hypothetical protein